MGIRVAVAPSLYRMSHSSKANPVPQESATLRVFLCHSSADKPFIRQLYDWLEASGITPWLDEREILPGQAWEQEITGAIRRSDVVLICLSQGSITKTGFVQKEIKFALDVTDEQPEGTIYLIPVLLEPCDVPERLRRWQWVELFRDSGYEQLMKALDRRAKGTLDRAGPVVAIRSPATKRKDATIIGTTTARTIRRRLTILSLSDSQRADVMAIAKRHSSDLFNGCETAKIALFLFSRLETLHGQPASWKQILEAASYLRDVGHTIAHTAHYKHAWYVVSNSEMSSFSERETQLIAAFCRYHGKGFPKKGDGALKGLSAEDRRGLSKLIPLFRLAYRLRIAREMAVDAIECAIANQEVRLTIHGADVDLEAWAASQEQRLFKEVYGVGLSVDIDRAGIRSPSYPNG